MEPGKRQNFCGGAMKTIVIIVTVLAAEAIMLVIFVNSGLYNVSTLSPDPSVIK